MLVDDYRYPGNGTRLHTDIHNAHIKDFKLDTPNSKSRGGNIEEYIIPA